MDFLNSLEQIGFSTWVRESPSVWAYPTILFMFIPTQRDFPIGSVLKVRFRLPRSNFHVSVRAEVRHCIPGSGVGVEFLELSAEAMEAIQNELGGE